MVPSGALRRAARESETNARFEEWRDETWAGRYADVFRSWIGKETLEHLVAVSGFQATCYPITNAWGLSSRELLQVSEPKMPKSVALGLLDVLRYLLPLCLRRR